jgi:hypothetical protein
MEVDVLTAEEVVDQEQLSGDPQSKQSGSRITSPPLTQSQSFDAKEAAVSQTTSVFSALEDSHHLPTPGDTQLTSIYPSEPNAEMGVEDQETMETPPHPVPDTTITKTKPRAASYVPAKQTPLKALSQTEKGQYEDIPMATVEEKPDLDVFKYTSPATVHGSSSPPRDETSATKTLRRSHRKRKSQDHPDANYQDPSVQLAKVSLASRKAGTQESPPPVSVRSTRSMTRSVRMSATPEVEDDSLLLARAALNSPSRTAPEEEKMPAMSTNEMKLQLNKDLRLKLQDFIALKVLRNQLNKTVDTMVVATATPDDARRPKHGPRDYMLTLYATDTSTTPTGVVVIQLFRPHRESLPVVRVGDVLLLRRFSVTAMHGRGFGLRTTETSSWAVFQQDRADGLPQIRGPPVEVEENEADHAALMLRWYKSLDEKATDQLAKATQKMIAA